MKGHLFALVCTAFLISGCGRSSGVRPNTVVFAVDMEAMISEGHFDPSTETVGVRGDVAPLTWGKSLKASDPDGDNVFELEVVLDSLPDAPIAFKFKVDRGDNSNDGWQEGPNRSFDVNESSRFEASFEDEAAERPTTFTGLVKVHEDFAPDGSTLRPRTLFVYLPPDYTTSGERYPVLYMHDGRNVFDASEVGAEWRMDEYAEELIMSESVKPFIIVGIGNTPDRTREYTPSAMSAERRYIRKREDKVESREDGIQAFVGVYEDGDHNLYVDVVDDNLVVRPSDAEEQMPGSLEADGGYRISGTGYTLYFERDRSGRVTGLVARQSQRGGGGPDYGRLIVREIKPFIDATYRTRPDRANTSLGGSSLGGLISMHLGLAYPEVFGQLLVVSPSMWWDDSFVVRQVDSLKSQTGQRIWLDMGTKEGADMVAGARSLNDALVRKGWTNDQLRFVEDAGADHSERAWAARTRSMLTFLYGN